MFRRVLAPVDGSTFSERSLPYAVQAAIADDAVIDLVLVHVRYAPVAAEVPVMAEIDAWEAEQRRVETEYLHGLADRLRTTYGVQVRPSLRDGDIVPALERMVGERDTDLVVMTTHGRGGFERAWLGSVSDALLRRLEIPILLVRAEEPASAEAGGAAEGGVEYRHVVIALDGSELAERSIAPALDLVGDAARVTLLRAVAPPSAATSPYLPHAVRMSKEELARREAEAGEYLERVQARLAESGREAAAAVVLDYHEAHAILQFARANGADLIAMGTHGRRPAARLFVGSVADKVVRAAEVPVLVC